MIRRYGPYGAAVAALVSIPVSNVMVAFAQPTVQAPAPAPTGGAAPAPAPTTTTTTTFGPYTPPGQAGNGPVGGGNVTDSSSRPKVGNETDHFDFKYGGGGGGTAYGSDNSPIFIDGGGGGTMRGGEVPWLHVVKKGDTLWGICDNYFQNPYQWPRIWSYNPQIQNPHWIYPGDQVHLRSGGGGPPGPAATGGDNGGGGAPTGGNLIDRRRQVPNNTVFLRDQGFIEDSSDENWGELTGAPVDKMFLTANDEAYVHLGDNRDVKLGSELTIFRPVRSVQGGHVIQILGTIKINQYNPQTHVARGTITESLDVIERGSRIGPVGRRFQVVPPVRNEKDIKAHIVASVHPHNFYGQNQVVFIDQGGDDGVRIGNRLFIIRRGDAWRRSLATPGAANRISPESEKLPDLEKTPGTRDEQQYPDEVIGELRVVAVRPHSATCVVTQSKAELERDDTAVARKGY